MTQDEIAALAMLLAEKTSLGALCSNMEIRTALEFMAGRGFLRSLQAKADAEIEF
jgi:hypothetical protein